jgi:hypothetical protein
MYGHTALQIWQGEGSLAVTTISGAQEGKQGCVLIYWEELAVALRPPFRRKIECEHPYFTEKWF